jgi:hypothetical protein
MTARMGGEHDVDGSSGESVTLRSRLRTSERIDVRQCGASQTDSIDGLEQLERFKDAKEAYACPQADCRGMLMTPVAPGTSSFLWINRAKQWCATLGWRVIRGGLCIRGACDDARIAGMSPRPRVVRMDGGRGDASNARDESALVASASRESTRRSSRVRFHCGVLRAAARKVFSLDGLREPCRRRS